MVFYCVMIFYFIYDLIFVRNDSSDNLAMFDVIFIVGMMICIEIRMLGKTLKK